MIDLDLYLRPHQREALKELSNGKILKGGVGTGKSRVAIGYYLKNEAPKDVYVLTTAKKRNDGDWQQAFYDVGLGPRTGPVGPPDTYPRTVLPQRDHLTESVSDGEVLPLSGTRGESDSGTAASLAMGGIGSRLPEREGVETNRSRHTSRSTDRGSYPWVVTVDSWNNISKYANVAGAFFIFDEQRLVGSGEWSRKFLRIAKRNTWLLLTATPGDNWMDYIPVFVANGFYKNRSEFKHRHVVYNTFTKYPKVDRYIEQGRLLRLRREITVEMHYEKKTKPHFIPILCEYDREKLDAVLTKRWHVYKDRPLRDIAELFSVARKVVNTDPSRLRKTLEVLKKHPRLIVFYNFNYELELLRHVSKSLPMAEWNGHRHQAVPTTASWLYLVQYTAGAEGWECITTDAELMYSQNYSYRITKQAEGRVDRLNTSFTDLYYYGLISDSWIDKAISRSLRNKEDFNERQYRKLMDR